MDLKKTHLYEFHKDHGNIVDFGGFAMPVWFEGIIPEHHAVRNAVGIFDTSHMGRTMAEGGEVEKFLNHVVTNNASDLEPMKGLYTVMCNPGGGIVDDLIFYKLADDRFFIVYNASNREKDFAWLREHSKGFDVSLRDISDEVAMIAIQGPRAEDTFQKICAEPVSEIDRFKIARVHLCGFEAMMARTGYTGEDGFELFILDTPLSSPEKALKVWNDLLEAGAEFGIKPIGLGARDSLRLEAGLSLYGNDIDDETNPLEARRLHREGGAAEGEGGGREAGPRRHKDGGTGDPSARLRDLGRGRARRRGHQRRIEPYPRRRHRPGLRAHGLQEAGNPGQGQDP